MGCKLHRMLRKKFRKKTQKNSFIFLQFDVVFLRGVNDFLLCTIILKFSSIFIGKGAINETFKTNFSNSIKSF